MLFLNTKAHTTTEHEHIHRPCEWAYGRIDRHEGAILQ